MSICPHFYTSVFLSFAFAFLSIVFVAKYHNINITSSASLMLTQPKLG